MEVLQNGLRKKIVQVVKVSATGDFDTAITLIHEYIRQIKQEQNNAEEAIEIVGKLLSGGSQPHTQCLRRKEVSKLLDISSLNGISSSSNNSFSTVAYNLLSSVLITIHFVPFP